MNTLQEDLDVNYPSSKITLLAINEEGEHTANAAASAEADLPLLQDVDADNDNVSDTWEDWEAVWRDVQVVDSDGNLTHTVNLTTNNLEEQVNYDSLRSQIIAAATAGRTADSDWQNAAEPYDVTGDSNVTPNDVLRIYQELNKAGPKALSTEVTELVDVNGDGFITALDAARVVRHLNATDDSAASEPPAAAPPSQSGAVDAVFAFDFDGEDDDEDEADS